MQAQKLSYQIFLGVFCFGQWINLSAFLSSYEETDMIMKNIGREESLWFQIKLIITRAKNNVRLSTPYILACWNPRYIGHKEVIKVYIYFIIKDLLVLIMQIIKLNLLHNKKHKNWVILFLHLYWRNRINLPLFGNSFILKINKFNHYKRNLQGEGII